MKELEELEKWAFEYNNGFTEELCIEDLLIKIKEPKEKEEKSKRSKKWKQ